MIRIFLICLMLTACASKDAPVARGLLATTDYRLIETRYCGQVERSAKVVAAFRRIHACPSTGLKAGACPDWQVDHVIPIDNGGCDDVVNMQWLPTWLKTCAGHCKDRWERKIYCKPLDQGGTGCENSVIQPKE
jgi:5-methylcytosine-specific restriction endonuclease McrA